MTKSGKTLGLIGSGDIGTTLARLAIANGLKVILSNSRGPASLAPLIANLGPLARAGTPQEVATEADWIVIAVPFKNYAQLSAPLLADKVVLDACNYSPMRDGPVAELDEQQTTSSELLQQHLPDAKVIKAFNNINFYNLLELARPEGAADRSALPIAGDDPEAKSAARLLLDIIGYDCVDVGSLAEGWRFEPFRPACVFIYAQNPLKLGVSRCEDVGMPTDSERLIQLLSLARR